MERVKKVIITILIVLVTQFILVGCWDNVDITERAYVSAIGLDKRPDGKLDVTLQIIKPAIIRAYQETGSQEKGIWVFTTDGDTAYEAIRNQFTTVNRRLFYDHLQIIVLGDEVAKEGIKEMLDVLERYFGFRYDAYVLIAKGISAKEVLECDSELEAIPALHIRGIVDNNVRLGKTNKVTIFDLIRDIKFDELCSVVPTIQRRPEIPEDKALAVMKHKMVEGAGIVKRSQLIGFLDGEETRGYLFAVGEIENTLMNIHNPQEEHKHIAINVTNSKSKMDAIFKNGELVLSIAVEVDGDIGEKHGLFDVRQDENLTLLENLMAEKIRGEVQHTITMSQEVYESDFFGFNMIVYRKYPQYWKNVSAKWNEEYSKLPVELDVKFKLIRTGLITN